MSATRFKVTIVTISVIGVAAIGSAIFFTSRDSSTEKPQILAKQVEYQDPNTKAKIKYPEDIKVGQISEEDKKSNIIFRLSESGDQKPFLVTLRSESGLRLVASATRAEIIDIVMGNSTKALPKRFPGYKEEDRRRFEQGGQKAGEIMFTYDSPVKGERIKQRFMILVKDDDTAVYLAMQAKELDYEEQNQKIFSQIADSLKFN